MVDHSIQGYYDAGVRTGFAVVAEMIERGDFETMADLYARLMELARGKKGEKE